jgi:hypothetical protein
MYSCIAYNNWCCGEVVPWGASTHPFMFKGGEVTRKVTESDII